MQSSADEIARAAIGPALAPGPVGALPVPFAREPLPTLLRPRFADLREPLHSSTGGPPIAAMRQQPPIARSSFVVPRRGCRRLYSERDRARQKVAQSTDQCWTRVHRLLV